MHAMSWFRVLSLTASMGGALLAHPVRAEQFVNQYISFELPVGWTCNLEQTEWVCRPSDPVATREAIFILTAKEVGPQDTLELYEDHLLRPISLQRRSGATTLSTVQEVKRRLIGARTWVVGTHFESEVPNYFTRYFATADEKIAILFTFSAHANYFDRWAAEVLPTLGSIETR
jgi:hypothetical protein